MLEIFSEIVWIAAGLGVFCTVVLFFLPDMYIVWKEAKNHIDYDEQLYELLDKAMQLLEQSEEKVTITFTKEGVEIEQDKE
jgi:hypothetical protein